MRCRSRIATAEARCPITACDRAARWVRSRSFIRNSRALFNSARAETAITGSLARTSGQAFPRYAMTNSGEAFTAAS
jgi:hypothetical protein